MRPYNSTKARILQMARRRGAVKTSELVSRLGISRQTVAQHCRELVAARQLAKLYSTRNATYVPYTSKTVTKVNRASRFAARHAIRGLEESRVFQEADLRVGLRRRLSPAAYQIVGYAFQEMLNNAIEHSRASTAEVSLVCEGGVLQFTVRDRGIGAFESVRRKFHLADHFEAVEHLLKGKQTTDPRHHSGQGIFFTSKAADRFVLESAAVRLVMDNVIDDVILADRPPLKGTLVTFRLKARSRRELKRLFDEYSDSAYEFDKTKVTVQVSAQVSEPLSRSQARRLLFGLEKFRRIVLDFKKVQGIGQGFADEIFRVFRNAHPSIRLEAVNSAPSVAFMIRRAEADRSVSGS